MSILRHDSLQSSTFDLGNMDQAVWNTLHGRLLHFTSYPKIGQTRLAAHVEPILLPVSLLYLLYSSPKTLLILQTVALSLAAWPLFLLGRAKLGNGLLALAPAVAYLLTPALQAVNLFDFHPIALAPPFLLSGLYFLERAETQSGKERKKSYAFFALFTLLALSCQETIALLVVAMGLYACLAHRRWRVGLPVVMVGALWFYVAVYVIIPHFCQGSSGSPYLRYYRELGDTPFEIAFALLTHPALCLKYVLTGENVQVVMALLLPFAGVPLLGWPVLLLAGPALAIVLLSANPLTHQMERYHYAATILPFVAAAAVYGLAGRWSKRRKVACLLAVLMVLAALGYQRYRGFLPLAWPFRWPQVTPHHCLLPEIAALIPPEAVLAAQAELFPHLSQRETIYLWPFVQDAEYVILDISHPLFANRDDAHSRLKEEVLSDGPFGLIASRDGYLLLQRGAPHAPLSDDFYTFARVEEPAIQYPMIVDFGPNNELDNERSLLRFLGFDVLYDRQEEVKFALYWQVLQQMEGDEFITLYLIDEGGKVVGSVDQAQPTLVWYPIQDWRPGETVRLLVNTLGWWTGDRSEYGVALGVMKGRETWEVSRRWGPLVRESEMVTRLRAEGALLELMRFRRIFGIQRGIEERRIFQPPRIKYPLEADLGGQVRLAGYFLSPDRLKAGQSLRLTLYWQAQRRMRSSYTVFVHLLDEDGLLRGQQDDVPGDGALPTTTWLEGEYVADEHQITLAEDASPGQYRLEVGLYERASGQRLNVLDGQGRVQGDSVPLDIPIQVTR